MAAYIVLFLCGLMFSLGLGISGMTQPEKVIGFLDFVGNWDPSLMLVLLGAVITYFIAQRFILVRETSVLGDKFQLPTRMDIDPQLVVGAAMFGTGWGMVGFCPGPALTSCITGTTEVLEFVIAMSLGMYLFGALHLRYSREPDGGASPLDHPNTAGAQTSARSA